ncbi:MAG: hypothetical protein ACLQFR_14450 [Streptosporangiaceae bacterium]
MAAEPTLNNAYLPQRSIYDQRYEIGRYDHRSAVRVLTAEREALSGAVNRALKSHPDVVRISLFDFGYGTGRVINDMITSYAHRYFASHKDLLVVAYDVSSVGLKKAQEALCSAGFEPAGRLAWAPRSTKGYIAGCVNKAEAGLAVTVVFVHGYESEPSEVMNQLALAANDGERYQLTTSWYSGLGHIASEKLRREYFRQLGELTSPHGEIVLSMSSTGDLTELQAVWAERLTNRAKGDFPIEVPGDLVYETELGQSNFFHVFGTDLNEHMKAITTTGQYWWVEGIRYPDEEFGSQEAEQANYLRVRDANNSKRGRAWDADDYREFHSVAAFRSPIDPIKHRAQG